MAVVVREEAARMVWRRTAVPAVFIVVSIILATSHPSATTAAVAAQSRRGTDARRPPADTPLRVHGAAYAYRSAVFTRFVTDSYHAVPSQGVMPFYTWFEQVYTTSAARLEGAPGLTDALAVRARAITASDGPARRAREELDTAVWAYRLIKSTIPRFSLSRGYEFVWTVRYGERQCLLQSVLVAGLLQAAGADAGVAMVWKNMAGGESNNGHAVTVLRLADGRDVEIDASEPRPIATHQGIFAKTGRPGAYRFLEPSFDRDGFITAYRLAGTRAVLRTRDVRPLGVDFLRSQFYYYRGEQTPGGLVNGPATAAGLSAAAGNLEISQRLDPQNPLAVYMLGRVYLRLGRVAAAKTQVIDGYRLYVKFGHVPDGPRSAYASVGRM
jgi:hypothetical protein